jgi:copper chaperone CopZ
MDDPRSVRAVTARLLDLPGVQWVQADAATARLTVGGLVDPAEVRRALHELGHDVDP